MSDVEHIKDTLDKKTENVILYSNEESKPKKNGGARPGAGRPKGAVAKKTLTAQQAKEQFIKRVHAHVDELFDAQLDLAKGEKILMCKVTERDEKGKVKSVRHEQVTDRDTIVDYLDYEEGNGESPHDDEHYFYMTVRPANNQALQGLLDRAFGKAPEKVEIGGSFFKADTINVNIVTPNYDANSELAGIIDVDPIDKSDDRPEPEAEPSANAPQ